MDNILSCWVVRPVTKDFALHFDVSSRLQTLEFRALLLQVVGWRNAGAADEARLDAVIAGYRASATTRVLAVTVEGACAGILALDLVAPARAVIRHIVVDRYQRRHGLGRVMIEAAAGHWGLAELEAETDRDAVDFYRRCGFRVQSLGEKFAGSDRFRCVLGGGQQAEYAARVVYPIRELAELLRNLEPVLQPGVYVFASVAPGSDVTALEPLAIFREAEGLSLIVEEGRAREAGLHALFRAAWITLEVPSDLHAVGFTALVSAALARAGISCNVVAAAAHDHLFVPLGDALRAMEALRGLQAGG